MSQRSSSSSALLTRPMAAPGSGVPLAVRIWTNCSKESQKQPAASQFRANLRMLIEDVLGPRCDSNGHDDSPIYLSRLPSAADALVASRQLQLAIQGFRRRSAAFPVAVSVAIDAGAVSDTSAAAPQPLDSDLLSLLESSRPAQVLLTHELCQKLSEFPGLPLRSFPGRLGVSEYLWAAPEVLEVLQSEPELTLSVISGAATNEITARPAPSPEPVATVAIAAESHPAPAFKAFAWLRSPVVIASAAALVLAAFILPMLGRRNTKSQPPTITTPASHPTRTQAPTAIIAPAPFSSTRLPGPPHAIDTITPRKHSPKQNLPTEPVNPPVHNPAPATSKCLLTGNLANYIIHAQQHRARSEYEDAIRLFHEVLDCDPGNADAQRGLKQAEAAAQEGPQ